ERVSSTNPRRRGCPTTGGIRGGAALVTSPRSAAACGRNRPVSLVKSVIRSRRLPLTPALSPEYPSTGSGQAGEGGKFSRPLQGEVPVVVFGAVVEAEGLAVGLALVGVDAAVALADVLF